MTTGAFLLILFLAACAAYVALHAVLKARAPKIRPAAPLPPQAAASARGGSGHLDALDAIPDDTALADLLAQRNGPFVTPHALERRAARLQERCRTERRPEPMRALAKLLIETIDAGVPDPQAFHAATRLFFASAPEPVLAEFAPEAEARVDAMAPWLDLDLAMPALRSVQGRVPGVLDRLIELADARGDAVDMAEVDALLHAIAELAAQGRPAQGDALRLAKLVSKRPHLMPRAVAEIASHPGDPAWVAAWMTLEARALSTGQAINVPAFRSRVMTSLRSDDPGLVASAATAVESLLDADAAGDIAVLWSAVGAALTRFSPPPAPLLHLADRLGLARPSAEG